VLVVIAQYKTRSGKGDEVAAILARHVAETRVEPGCLQFTVNRSTDDPERFVLYEQYVDEAAFELHRLSPHFERNVDQGVVPLLAERTWGRYQLVD